jgi:hypothetical protein
MMAARKVVWLGFMLLLVSAMLIPQVAAALEIAPAASQAAWGQPLPDSTLKDLAGRDSLVGAGNGLTNVVYQYNSSGVHQFDGVKGLTATPIIWKSAGTNYPYPTIDPNKLGTIINLFNFKR